MGNLSVIRLENITITLKESERKLVDGLCLTCGSGDKIAIIGEEGDGKSTLLKYVYDRQSVAGYCHASGKIIYGGKIGYLPQFWDGGDISVIDYLGGDVYDGIKYAALLGIDTELLYSELPMSALSGGERVKIMLYKLMLDEPDVILLDEPTNDLDIDTLCSLENFIVNTRCGVIFISHDVSLLRSAATAVLHLEQLKKKTECKTTFCRLGYDEYIEARRSGLEHQTEVALKQRDEYDKQLRKWQRIHDRVEHEQRVISRGDPGGGRLLKKKMRAVLSQRRRFERERDDFLEIPDQEEMIVARFEPVCLPAGKTIIDLDEKALFAGDKLLAHNVRLNVTGKSKVAIIGKNGVGKSTLLRLIYDRLKDRSDIRLAYMPQNYSEALDFDASILDVLSKRGSDMVRARQLLGNMRFTSAEMTGKIGALSGGQQAKLIFLFAVFAESNVLLLDEPTRNFSPLSAPAVCAALKSFDGAIISVSHDAEYYDTVCDRVYELTPNGLVLI